MHLTPGDTEVELNDLDDAIGRSVRWCLHTSRVLLAIGCAGVLFVIGEALFRVSNVPRVVENHGIVWAIVVVVSALSVPTLIQRAMKFTFRPLQASRAVRRR